MMGIWLSKRELSELCRKGRFTVYNYSGRASHNYSQIVKLKDTIIEYFSQQTYSLSVSMVTFTRVLDVAKTLNIPPKDAVKYFDKHIKD